MTIPKTFAASLAMAALMNTCALLGAQTAPAAPAAAAEVTAATATASAVVPGQMLNPAPDAVAEAAADAEKPTPWTERESLFLEKANPAVLADAGFTPYATWTGEQWSNLSGGYETGTIWDSLLTFGFEQDLSKLFKKEKLGTLGMSVFWYQGSGDFAEKLDTVSAPSNIFAADMVRIFEIYYANEFTVGEGTMAFRVGQLATDEDFMGLDYADIFLNSNFGAIITNAGTGLANGDTAFGQYANATLGGVANYSFNDTSVMLGLYNGDAGQDTVGNHGFDYTLQDVAFWYQLQQNYKVFGRQGLVAFGGNYHSGEFLNYNTQANENGFYSFYLNAQQDLIVNEENEAIVGGFMRLGWAPQDAVADVTQSIEAGLNWFGPIPERVDDIFAVGVSVVQMGSGWRNAQAAAGDPFFEHQTCLETTYKVQVTKAISVQPTMQVYFNPIDANGEETTAFVAGIRVEVNF